MTVAENQAVIESEEKSMEEIVGDVEQAVETTTTEETGSTGILEQEEKTEGLSLEEINSPKSDIKKGKDGTSPAVQKRIDTLVAERNQAKKELKEEKAKTLSASKPVVPLADNYEKPEEYQADFEKYLGEKTQYDDAVSTLTEVEVEQNAVIESNNERYKKQAEELQEKFPNINIREKIDNTIFGTQGVHAIAKSEHSAKIALYYALNPKALAEFSKLNYADACTEIGRQEGKIVDVQKKETTNASEPLNTLKGETATVTKPKNLYEIKDNSEWLKERNRQIRGGK